MNTSFLYCGAWSFRTAVSGIRAFRCENGKYQLLGVFGEELEAQSILRVVGDRLLSVCETRGGGKIVSYRLRPDGTPQLCDVLQMDTPLLSYITIAQNGRYAFVSSMGRGLVKMLRIAEDGRLTETDEFLLTGHSVTNRQEAAKTHSVQMSPDGSLLAAANLGADEVELFRIDYEKETLRLLQSVPVDFGRQPRHMAFHPGGEYLYLLTESGNRVYVYRVQGQRLRELAAYNTLDPELPQIGMAADIVVRPDGRFIYASNRAQNNVAVWRVLESGLLDLVGHFACGGEGPRGLHISADGDELFCANNDSGTVTVLPLDKEKGKPGPVRQSLNVPCASCVKSV